MVFVIPLLRSGNAIRRKLVDDNRDPHINYIDIYGSLKVVVLQIIGKHIFDNMNMLPYEIPYNGNEDELMDLSITSTFRRLLLEDVDASVGTLSILGTTKELIYYDCIITSNTIILNIDIQ